MTFKLNLNEHDCTVILCDCKKKFSKLFNYVQNCLYENFRAIYWSGQNFLVLGKLAEI